MYGGWFFFTNLIDDIELALARADLGIAAATTASSRRSTGASCRCCAPNTS